MLNSGRCERCISNCNQFSYLSLRICSYLYHTRSRVTYSNMMMGFEVSYSNRSRTTNVGGLFIKFGNY